MAILSTLICLKLLKYSLREVWFVSWGSLRGAVPIIFATFSQVGGVPESRMIFNLVCMLIQGTTLGVMARWMKVKDYIAPKPTPIFKSRRAGKDFIEYMVEGTSPLVGLNSRLATSP